MKIKLGTVVVAIVRLVCLQNLLLYHHAVRCVIVVMDLIAAVVEVLRVLASLLMEVRLVIVVHNVEGLLLRAGSGTGTSSSVCCSRMSTSSSRSVLCRKWCCSLLSVCQAREAKSRKRAESQTRHKALATGNILDRWFLVSLPPAARRVPAACCESIVDAGTHVEVGQLRPTHCENHSFSVAHWPQEPEDDSSQPWLLHPHPDWGIFRKRRASGPVP